MIGYEVDGAIATVTICGADEYNAFTPSMYLELHERLVQLDADPSVAVGILRGAGNRHFSSGADVAAIHGAKTDLLSLEGTLERFWNPTREDPPSDWAARIPLVSRRTVKPVVAAVQGVCLGTGLVILGLHTDLRIAGESARFGFSDVRMGFGGSSAVTSRLARQISRASLMWMLEAGEDLDGRAAAECSLVNEVVPDAQVFARAAEVADMVAAMPRDRVRLEKLALIHLEDAAYEDAVVLSAGLRSLATG